MLSSNKTKMINNYYQKDTEKYDILFEKFKQHTQYNSYFSLRS